MDTERLTNEEKKMMSLFPDLTATFINEVYLDLVIR